MGEPVGKDSGRTLSGGALTRPRPLGEFTLGDPPFPLEREAPRPQRRGQGHGPANLTPSKALKSGLPMAVSATKG